MRRLLRCWVCWVLAYSALTIIGVLMAVFLVAAADVVDDRRRIELYTLLGASRRFIRRPYLYRATILGVLAGLIACLVITLLNEVLFSILAIKFESSRYSTCKFSRGWSDTNWCCIDCSAGQLGWCRARCQSTVEGT